MRERAWLAAGARTVARRLLGCSLVRTLPDGTRLAGQIVEVEAYVGVGDPASHAYRGRRTPRNEQMYARAGTAYVYFTYGMHWCLNVVCAAEGVPEAVLIRALEPTEGLDVMRANRRGGGGAATTARKPLRDWELCRGPACLTRALGIDGAFNGADLLGGGRLAIEWPAGTGTPTRVGGRRGRIVQTGRVGIAYSGVAATWPLRYVVAGHPSVSGPRGRE